MERELYRRCVKRIRHFLAPHWNGGKGALRKFVRKLLAPFKDSPHILHDLVRTPVKILALAGITLSLAQAPAVNVSPTDIPAAQREATAISVAPEARASAHSSSDRNLLSDFTTVSKGKAIAFIDRGVTAPDDLAKVAPEGVEVHFIDTDRSGIAQITEVLAGYQSLGAVHLLSHGGPGYLKLGSDVVTRDVLSYHAQELRSWGESLTKKADLLVYGCEVAGSPDGRAFLSEMGELTGADVAGSEDLTGSAKKGGDWNLEYLRGSVETASLSPRSADPYEGILKTFTVANTNDSGAGSLRQAIIDANGYAGADTIDFAPGLNYYTIGIYSDLPDITEDLTITGPGSGKLTIDGNYYQVFDAYDAGTTAISGLTIRYGQNYGTYGGGGIANHKGTMTITDCHIYYSNGEYGGAIANTKGGTLTVDNSTLSYNYARRGGGGIGTPYSDLTVTNSTIYRNTGNNSGAIGSRYGGLMTVTNCYIGYNKGNKGSGGIIRPYGDISVSDSWFYGNVGDRSGALRAFNGGTATISNCDFRYNRARNYGGAISAYNTSVLDVTDTTIFNNIATRKGPGAQDGGGLYLNNVKATIDNTTISYNSADYGGGIFSYNSTIDIRNMSSVYYNYASDGGGIRSSLSTVTIQGNSSIERNQAGYVGGIQSFGGSVTIDGSSVDWNRSYAGYWNSIGGIGVFKSGSLSVQNNSTVSNNYGYTSGGIYNYGSTTTVDNSTVSGNTAYAYSYSAAGGISNNYGGSLTVRNNSSVSDNDSYGMSGGIVSYYGDDVSITDSTISGNETFSWYGWAGAVDHRYSPGTIDITNSTLSGNTGYFTGGLDVSASGDATVTNCTVSGNYGLYYGGISNWDGSSMKVENSKLMNNDAPFGWGGGIINDATLTISNSTISGNYASTGGGIENWYNGTLTVDRCSVTGNSSDHAGGGIRNAYMMTVTNSTVSGNYTSDYGSGGGFSLWNGSDATIRNSTISGNTCGYEGGGILLYSGPLSLYNTTIANNQAGTYGAGYEGGGIYVYGVPPIVPAGARAPATSAKVESTIFAGNTDSATPSRPDISDMAGYLSAKFSLVQDANGHKVMNGVDNNQVGVDPQLQPLADNGGPTMTHEILLTSPAINTGSNPLTLTTDQRGEAREARGGVDIGAYERQNVLPTIISAVADPNPTQVGQTITFTADATDADGDTLTYAWDFGDGSTATGATATHAYAALGTYTVTLTVSDPFGSVSTTLIVIIEQAEGIAGVGPDTDGDGFSDSLETFVGSDPLTPGSTPMNLTALGTPELTLVKGLRVILKPGKVGKDKIRFVGWLPIPDGTAIAGQEVILDISGVQKRFTLDSRGRGKDGNTLITVGRPKLGFAVVKVIRKFQGDYKDEMLQYSGLDNADVNKELRTIRATILFNGRSHVTDLTVTYKAKQNKKGVAWKWIKQRLP